ncbi:MAG TPA: DHA2 family efflux MFS transporter permease subunit [Acetobacteraceae bacterium]|nr:DHA2 family efflux MFS transporter permease subunit [Acetobacteraceae bacterium]
MSATTFNGGIALPRSAAGPYSPWLIAVIVSIATFMEVLDTTIANVSLLHIAGSLSISQDESTWILTSYLVSNAIILPISGWLANVMGRKRFYMTCVVLFTVSSLMCAFANSLSMMILFRVLQGMGGGGLAPTEQSMIADTFPPEKRAQVFALYGLTVVLAPAIGPVLGGWLTDNFSWRWVFLINGPVGLLSLTLTSMFVTEPPALIRDRKRLLASGFDIDYIGFALVALGFGTLQVVLDKFARDDGFSSPFIVWFSMVSAVSLVTLIAWEWLHPHPVMNVRLLRIPAFGISNAVMFLIGFMLISTTQLLPQMTQELMGYSATQAGLTLAAGGVVTLIVMPLSGIVTGRLIQPKWLLVAALIVSGLALLHLSSLTIGMSFWQVSAARAFQTVALPFLFIPISAVSYVGVPPDKSNEASPLINLMRNLGGSFGVSFVTTLLAWREQFHHARLAEHITTATNLGGLSLARISQMVQTQATQMSYLDIFWLLAIIALVVWPIVLFLPNMPKGAAPSGH